MDYLVDGTFATPRRLTENSYLDVFPTLSPDGKGKIVFDSNRRRAYGEPLNTSDLFLMSHDGTDLTFLTRGGSPACSPVGPHGKPRRRSHSMPQGQARGCRSRTIRVLRPKTATSSS
jgi:Tol biopolymer transport system component